MQRDGSPGDVAKRSNLGVDGYAQSSLRAANSPQVAYFDVSRIS